MKLVALSSVVFPALLVGCIVDLEPSDIDDLEEVDVNPIESKTWNSKTWNSIVLNAVITDPETIDTLIDNPLATPTFVDERFEELRLRAGDNEGIQFLDYLTQCALEPHQGLKYLNPRDGSRHTFRGALGLCPQWGEKGVRGDNACTEAVSGCLMARINAFGEPVNIVIRGMTSLETPLPLEDPLFSSAQGVSSTKPCVGTIDTGPGATCGWDPGMVGKSEPGSSVTVRGPWGCSSYDDSYRVCRDESACDPSDASHIASKTNCAWWSNTTRFTCPASGAFSLMRHEGNYAGYAAPRVFGSGVLWPASELDVFTFREGAFFGQLFDGSQLGLLTRIVPFPPSGWFKEYSIDGGLTWTTQPPQGRYTAYQGMFVCHSGSWDFDEVLAKKRVCAGSTGWECAAMHVGNCSSVFTHPDQNMDLVPLYPHGVCKDDDSPAIAGDRDYDNCINPEVIDPDTGEPRVWAYPITTFLTDACSGPYDELIDSSGRNICVRREPIGPRPILPRPLSPFVGVSR